MSRGTLARMRPRDKAEINDAHRRQQPKTKGVGSSTHGVSDFSESLQGLIPAMGSLPCYCARAAPAARPHPDSLDFGPQRTYILTAKRRTGVPYALVKGAP